MRDSTLGHVAIAAIALALGAVGCESSNSDKSGGHVTDRDQQQTTMPDGTQQRTRTQVRETPSGTVQETQIEQRKPVQPGQPADATQH